jgi:excisionase family DNA binding protein
LFGSELLAVPFIGREGISPTDARRTMDMAIETEKDEREERLVYSVAEAGELLGISRAFAYELVGRGELPVIRLGRRRLVCPR